MGFRYALEKDKENVKNLWTYSFNDDITFTDYYFNNRYFPKYNALWEEDTIKASLQLNPYILNIRGRNEKTSYVVGISVYPEYRGQKLTTKLLECSLLDLVEKGENIALLMPIDTDIYRRYGFENCFDMEIYNLQIKDIKIEKEDLEKTRRLKEINQKDIEDLLFVYENSAKDWDNYIKRDKDYFGELFKEVKVESGEIFISYDNNKCPSGYMILYPKFDVGSKGFVREMFYNSSASLNVFLSIIKSHSTQFKEVEIHQQRDSYLKDFWGWDNKVNIQIKPFMMARILNVKKLLNNLDIKTEFPIKIQIIDPQININNKLFLFSEKGVSKESDTSSPDFKIDIGTLTQIVMGYITIESAIFTKNITFCKNEQKDEIINSLKEVFSQTKSFLNDYI